tara:strand:+ start:222 stop:404 length:183 start_codon:yes stop_codon:yes gene_type:complete
MRKFNALLITPLLKLTGYRFSKAWRHGDTTAKRFIYEYVLDTVTANQRAGLPPVELIPYK